MTNKTDWQTVKFGDVVRLNKDRIADPLAAGVERYVGLEHITPEDLRIRSWGSVAEGTTFTNAFKPGQVLFGKRRAYQRKVAVADFAGVCSGDIYVLEPKDDRLLPELLPFLCQTERFFQHAVGTSAGSLSPRTNWTQLAKYEFALPPLDEQRRIGRVLSTIDLNIDSYLTMLQSAINLKNAVRKSAFDPDKCKVYKLSNLCEQNSGIKIGPFGAQLHQSDYIDAGIPVIMPTNMIDDTVNLTDISQVSAAKADELSVHKVKENDILLPRRGELDRRAYITKNEEGWLCGTGSIRIRLRQDILSKAVFHSIASSHVLRWLIGNAVGTTMPNLNSKIVSQIPVALPSLNEQKDIIDAIDRIQIEIRQIDERLKRAKQMKNIIFHEVSWGQNV